MICCTSANWNLRPLRQDKRDAFYDRHRFRRSCTKLVGTMELHPAEFRTSQRWKQEAHLKESREHMEHEPRRARAFCA